MKSMDRLNIIYILLFFFGQNNFYLTHKLCLDLGIGIGAYRSIILISFIIFGFILIFLNVLFKNIIFIYNKTEIFIISLIIAVIIVHLIFDYSKDNSIDFIGVASLIEGIFMLIFCGLLIKKSITINYKIINFISIVIFANITIEMAFYFSDLFTGISYGPFRANIGGFTINRNPSFFYPIFALIILQFCNLNKILKLIYTLIFILYVFTFFYRTIYIAILLPFLIDKLFFFEFRFHFSLKKVIKFFIITLLIIVLIYFINYYIDVYYNFSIINIFIDRFTSTGVNVSDDPAQTQRIDQIPEMIIEILKSPLGIGFNGSLVDGPVYLFAYYFLHPILYLGWIFVFALVYYYKRFIILMKGVKKNYQYRIIFIAINYFFIVLVFFPYMSYFTFTSIIVLLFSISRTKIMITF